MIAKYTNEHRGRMQAQGGPNRGIEESEHWAQVKPLLASAGRTLLDTLKNKLRPADQLSRQLAFAQAHTFIDRAEANGGHGPDKKTFPVPNKSKTGIRVDIEIHGGLAFVPDHKDDEKQEK